MKSAAYYRSSTSLQENSVDMQRQSVLKCAIKNAEPIDEEYIDEAVSARKLKINKRPELKRLLSEVENDEVKKLFVYKRDRLARQSGEYMKIYQLFKSKNLDVIFTAENEPPINYSPIGEFFELLMAGVVQREADQIVERISQTIKAKFEEGINFGPGIPYGYEKDKDKIIKIDEELDIVKFIYAEVLTGKYNDLGEIRKVLKDKGLKRKHKDWSVPSIRKVLSEPTYMGVRFLTVAGEKVESSKYDHLSIMDQDSWFDVQRILERIDNKETNSMLSDVNFPLHGLLFCSHCEKPLKGNRARNHGNLRYYCEEHKEIFVQKAQIEEKLIEHSHLFFRKLLDSHMDSFFENYIKKYSGMLTANIKTIEKNREKRNKKLIDITEKWFYEKNGNLKAIYENSILGLYDQITIEDSRKIKLLNELIEIENLPQKIKEQKQQYSLTSTLAKLDDAERTVFYQDIISKVFINEHSIHIQFKHPFLEVKEGMLLETI